MVFRHDYGVFSVFCFLFALPYPSAVTRKPYLMMGIYELAYSPQERVRLGCEQQAISRGSLNILQQYRMPESMGKGLSNWSSKLNEELFSKCPFC